MAELEKRVETLGNVSKACMEMNVSRSQYYKWKASIRTKSPERQVRRHPQAIPLAVREQILTLARQYPDWGCDRISYFLELQRKSVSATTVQKILRRHGLGKMSQRGRDYFSQL